MIAVAAPPAERGLPASPALPSFLPLNPADRDRPRQRARPLLGTLVSIRIDACERNIEAAFARAFDAVAAIQACMSFHDAGSELSRLNREAAAEPQRVGRHLWRVLRASLALARASDGLFDPTTAARLVRSGFLPAPAAGIDVDPAATWRDVELLPGRRVRYRAPLWLDFGGIAKGYVVDCAVAALRASGVHAGNVNAGGDLRVFGATSEVIRVRAANDPSREFPLLSLREGAVATSAGYFSVRDGQTPLIDTRDGRSLGLDASVSVCAPRAIWADALTKVVFADPAVAARLLPRLRAQAVLCDAGGRIRTFG